MDRRVEKTRKSIREAYFDLLMRDGKRKITIAEIARNANIDRKTFYLLYLVHCVYHIVANAYDIVFGNAEL